MQSKAAAELSPIRGDEDTVAELSMGWWASKRTSAEKQVKSNEVCFSFIALSQAWFPSCDKCTWRCEAVVTLT